MKTIENKTLKHIKIAALSAAILTCLPAMALDYYVGAAGGFSNMNIDQKMQYTKNSKSQNEERQYNSYGLAGTAYAGAALSYKRFYLATEFDATMSAPQASASIQNFKKSKYSFKVTQSIGNHMGISLKPGFFISNNNLIYLKLGALHGQVTSTSAPTDADPKHPHMANNLGYSGNFTKNLWGMELGLGIESYFTKSLSLHIEYDYQQYQSFTMQQSKSAAPYLNSPATLTYHPSSNNLMVGVTWHLPFGNNNNYPNFKGQQVAMPIVATQAKIHSTDDIQFSS